MHVKCWVHIFSGSFGSFGSAVEKFLWREVLSSYI